MSDDVYRGGCQCGRIRYDAVGPRDRASVCFCRMCQKASGGPFMAFVRVRSDRIVWHAAPSVFASSDKVERGFCAGCGTPLTYRWLDSPFTSLTVNSLDEPSSVAPEMAFYRDREASWLRSMNDLPDAPSDPAIGYPDTRQSGR